MKEREGVSIFIPRNAANQDPNFYAAVNGRNYVLPRGKSSTVPLEAAAEIERARAAEDAMYEAREALKTPAE